jgi:hypothetical protein
VLIAINVALVLAAAVALGDGRGHRLLRELVRDYYALVGDTGGPLTVVDRGRWDEIEPGLELHRIVVTRPRNLSKVELVALRIDPARYRFEVITAPDFTWASEVGESEGAAAVINGGYFDARGRPLGLLIANGVQVAGELARAEGRAVFGVRDGQPFVADAAGLDLAGITEALQTTPLLVRDGAEVEGFAEPWRIDRRAAVCVDPQGRVIFTATDTLLNGLSFSEIAHLMAREIDRGGLDCQQGMNLDGGTSAQLWIDGHDHGIVPGYTDVPVFLLAIPRAAP